MEQKEQTREITIVTQVIPEGAPEGQKGGLEGTSAVIGLPAKVEEKRVVEKKVAYIIRDSIGVEVEIYETGEDGRAGWWKDVSLVRQLITALKVGHGPTNAARRIGISRAAFYRFLDEHPGFRDIMDEFKEVRTMKVTDGVNTLLDKVDPATVRWAAENLLPEFQPKEKSPIVIVPISMREVRKKYEIDEAAGA